MLVDRSFKVSGGQVAGKIAFGSASCFVLPLEGDGFKAHLLL